VDEDEMPVVRRIFEMIGVEGRSIRAVRRAFASEGLPTPGGMRHWSQMTIRALILDDVYKPHTHEEILAPVSPEVAERLDPEERYGVYWYNTRKNTYRQVAEVAPDGKRIYRKTRKVTQRSREEWIGVPVSDSGVTREWVDSGREAVESNRRAPSRNHRFWELSGGLLRCALCGGKMRGHHSRGRGGPEPRYFYYRCGTQWDNGSCPHNKQHRAEDTEGLVWGFVRELLGDPQRLRTDLERMIEMERAATRGNPDREAKAWHDKLTEVDAERRGYLRLAARGSITDAELDAALAELEETRRLAEEELGALRSRQERLEVLKRDKDTLLEAYARMTPTALDSLTPEERHRVYGMLGLKATITMEGALEVSGAFSGEGDALCGTITRYSTP
jgi:hypothetical protein